MNNACVEGAAPLTVVDVLNICRTLVVEPTDFAALIPAVHTPSLAMDDSGSRFELVLRRSGPAPACPFLLRTSDQTPFCGLGETAPAGCQGEPTAEAELAIHEQVLNRWNAYAGRWPSGELGLADLGRFVLDATAVLVDGRRR